MAEAANQQGNAFYKEGQYTKAVQLFTEAALLDPKDPKYPSNLSAVLYELGRYPESIIRIQSSWNCLRITHAGVGMATTPPATDPLALKLAIRMAKAKINGVCSRTISLHKAPSTNLGVIKRERVAAFLEADMENFAMSLPRSNANDPKVKEMRSAWEHWRTIRAHCKSHLAAECQAEIVAAETRLRALHIFKSASDPTLEYYTFGHDLVRSLMNGLNGSCEDDYRLDDPERYEDKKNWSFLFGGSGDGRHVFTTLLHLSDMANESGDGSQTDALNIHMTLIDVHPASLARIIVVLALLRQILHTRLIKNMERRVELYSTLFYLYSSIVMPDYCRQIVMETAKTLVKELPRRKHALSKCLHINKESLPAILVVLRFWSKPLKKSTKIHLASMAESNIFFDGLEDIAAMMGLPDIKKDQRKELKGKNKLTGEPLNAYDDPEAERTIFKRITVLLPPKSHISRHPALAELVKSYKSASDSLYNKVTREVEKTWLPNPTLFDKTSTEHGDLTNEGGYPRDSTNPFDSFESYATATVEFEHRKPAPFCRGTTGFEVTTRFFDMAADAIWELQNTLKVEMIVGDAMTGTPKLLAGELGPRPREFPRSYSRMWLSNVPDYTHGLLSTAVHLVPHLQPGELAMSNCLLNSGSWSTLTDFCFNYTLLLPRDVPRILGCKVINPQNMIWDDIALKQLPLPRRLGQLASKKELHDWLSRLLLCILCNGISQAPPSRIDMPSNLGAFFHVLVHLHRVGFPSHWIGDFVQSVISDNLVTEAEPYLERLPIPLSFANKKKRPRRVHLGAWQAELEVIFASTKAALPFSVALPSEYPTASDICVYKATVQPIDLTRHRLYGVWASLSSPFTRTVGLIFYKPHKDIDAEELAHRVASIIEGSNDVKDVKVQIMLSQEHVDLSTGDISWKMSGQWYEKMAAEKWTMAAYRTDLCVAVSKPLGADQWQEMSA